MNSLTQIIEPTPTAPSVTKEPEAVKCCIFLDEYPLTDCIGCTGGHWVSKEALGPYVDTELEKPISYHQKLKGLKCPACTETFAGERLLELLSPEMRAKYSTLQKQMLSKEQHEEEVAAAPEEDVEKFHESIRLQFTDGKGRLRGRMCPTCHFGPIDHFACNDLKAHHNQKIAEGIRISNACPICCYFHRAVEKWEKWDGTFLSIERMDSVKSVRQEHVDNFEAYREAQEQKYKKYELDSALVEEKYQQAVAQYKLDLDNYNNYYPNNGVRAPHIVRREMSAAKGEKKLELAREYRKAFRLWNRQPKEPTHPTGSAEQWLQAKRSLIKKKVQEEEQKMREAISLSIQSLSA